MVIWEDYSLSEEGREGIPTPDNKTHGEWLVFILVYFYAEHDVID